jgi:ribosomal protein S18 acetylase RimI-like enzyme
MNNEILVLKLEEGDITETAQVSTTAFNFVNQGCTEKESLEYIKRVFLFDFNYVAKENGEILGFIIAQSREDHIYIDAIAVHPNNMNRGIGKLLLNNVLKLGKEKGFKFFKMTADPKSIAYSWYSKIGFKETGWVELILETN